MRATAWHNGQNPHQPAGYGIKLAPADRDRTFQRHWTTITLHLDGADPTTIELTPSFWNHCSELRSADIGRWLLHNNAAPWPTGTPPAIALRHTTDNHFTARILQRRNLL